MLGRGLNEDLGEFEGAAMPRFVFFGMDLYASYYITGWVET